MPGTSGGPTAHAGTSASHTAASAIEINGLTLVPFAAGSPALRYHGRWRRHSERGALEGAIMLGAAGATVTTTLAPGRPAFVLRDVRRDGAGRSSRRELPREVHPARVEQQRIAAAAGGSAFSHAGPVTLRVIAGTVGIDGVAVTP